MYDARFVLRFEQLNFPHNFNSFFEDSSKELALDIGAGKGEFIEKISKANPSKNYLCIEVRSHRVNSIVKRIQKHQLSNVRVLHARIEHVIPHAFFPGSVSHIYMNFPDPWQKNKQKNRRTVTTLFLDQLSDLLTEDGKFYFATDVKSYASHCYKLLDRHPHFFNELPDKPWLEQVDELYHTLFYYHALKEGRSSHFLRFAKSR